MRNIEICSSTVGQDFAAGICSPFQFLLERDAWRVAIELGGDWTVGRCNTRNGVALSYEVVRPVFWLGTRIGYEAVKKPPYDCREYKQ